MFQETNSSWKNSFLEFVWKKCQKTERSHILEKINIARQRVAKQRKNKNTCGETKTRAAKQQKTKKKQTNVWRKQKLGQQNNKKTKKKQKIYGENKNM